MTTPTVPMTAEECAAMLALVEKMTPEPWEQSAHSFPNGHCKAGCYEGTFTDEWGIYPPLGEVGPVALVSGEDDVRAIVALRNAAPQLFSTIEALRAECGGWASTVMALLDFDSEETRLVAREMLSVERGLAGSEFLKAFELREENETLMAENEELREEKRIADERSVAEFDRAVAALSLAEERVKELEAGLRKLATRYGHFAGMPTPPLDMPMAGVIHAMASGIVALHPHADGCVLGSHDSGDCVTDTGGTDGGA